MRICVRKSDGRVLEMQSHAREGTLISNAVASGMAEDAVEERVVTAEEYADLMAQQREESPRDPMAEVADILRSDPKKAARLKELLNGKN